MVPSARELITWDRGLCSLVNVSLLECIAERNRLDETGARLCGIGHFNYNFFLLSMDLKHLMGFHTFQILIPVFLCSLHSL